jgi:hypothetical protein
MVSKFIQTALDRFELAREAETEFRRNAKEDLEFVNGDQWNANAKNNRENAGLPCYTVNKVQEYLRHITNEIRQNKPSIQVDPVGNGADKDTADIVAGLIKHIEYDSAADTAYDTASWYAAATGLGYMRVVSQYEDYTTDNQKLVIKTVENPATVFYDPHTKMPDGSDAEWCFIVTDMPADEYKRKYGDSEVSKAWGTSAWTEMTNSPEWLSEQSVRVAEYYCKDYESKTLYHVMRSPDFENPDGVAYTSYEKPSDEDMITGKAIITKKRPVQVPVIKWCTLNCQEVLGDTTVWPGEWIPVIPVKGNEFWIDGKRQLSGSVRNSKDAQRSYNWLVSIQTQMIASAPLAPFVGFKGQFKDVEAAWRDVNVAPIAYLEVDSIDSNGVQQQLPQRMSTEPAIQAIAATRNMAGDDIKAVFGTFDASLGDRSNETSGKAILARTQQSNISNYHYHDNQQRSITHLGRILVQAIPTFYDTERVIRIVKEDGTRGQATINTTDPRSGKPKNDFSIGKYDIVIETGPSFATRRQEAASEMQTLMQAYPAAGPLIADLAAGAMDWPGSSLVAKRLKAAVPQEVLAATGEGDEEKMEPAAKVQMLQQQLTQAMKHLEALNAHAQATEDQLKLTSEENKLIKMSQHVDVTKLELDARLKSRAMDIEEETTVLEFKVKEQELALQERTLAIKEAEMGIKAVAQASNMNHQHMDRIEANMRADAEKGGVGNMPSTNLTTDMDHSLGDDLGGKFGG